VVITASEEFISPEEVGERLGVSVYTVRRWIKAGQLRAFRPGKEYRIQGSDLEEFLRAREVRPKAPRRSPFEPSFNDVLEEERRAPTEAELIAVAAVSDFCDQLEGFLLMAQREDLAADVWAMQRLMVKEIAATSLPLMENAVVLPLLRPTANRLVELARKLEESAQSAGVGTGDTGDVIEAAERFAQAG